MRTAICGFVAEKEGSDQRYVGFRGANSTEPKMDCGTHIITGGTGKYKGKGITGSEPFACISMPALAGAGDYFAMDILHNTTWEIK